MGLGSSSRWSALVTQRVDGKEAKQKPRQYGAVFYCQP
ncbi:hypothetical protein D083_1626 [Dickeya solani RNS 08.23.3.1.A]|nr:hypothetical protein D083_1626 [Dickeya solani RNS 08.23.3.1.A]